MDIYLGAKCFFWLTTGTGIDSLTKVFRKPVVYTNNSPMGHATTTQHNIVCIHKHHYDLKNKKMLSLNEIKEKGLSYSLSSDDFAKKGVKLIYLCIDTNEYFDLIKVFGKLKSKY